MALPVDFKDDILDSSMGGKKRYNMITNADGTVSFEDVTVYTQVGSNFGQGQINATNEEVNNARLKAHPVGSIYMSIDPTNPSEESVLGGGTWILWGAGRVPVGVDEADADFNTVEKTGGEKTHTLTNAEIDWETIHNDGATGCVMEVYSTSPNHGGGLSMFRGAIDISGESSHMFPAVQNDPELLPNDSSNFGLVRQGQSVSPHNNLQPYITCYMWKRTA